MDFRAFEATPGIHVVVHADTPSFTIAAVSEDFLRWSGHTRDSLTGKSYFQTSYDDLNKKEQEKSLRSMFQQVVAEKAPVEKLIPSAPHKTFPEDSECTAARRR